MFKAVLKARWFWFARWICRVFCILFIRLRVCGKDNVPEKGPFILIGNHQSYLDPVLCGVPLKPHLHFLARDTLFTHWFFGRLISSVNTLPVKRDRPDLSAMKKIIDILKQGKSACLFPEGTRSSDGKIKSFKPGFGLLARRANAAIVPVVVDGAFECWPRHKKLFSPGATIIVSYGRPIKAQQIEKMTDRELAETLNDTLRKMQSDCRVKQGKEPYKY